MKNILNAPFLVEMVRTATNMYSHGWDERNGGNLSCLLDEKEVGAYLDTSQTLRTFPMAFDAGALAGKIFIVTGTGKYFRNIPDNPAENLGIIRVAADGRSVGLLWGYEGGGAPTSELPAHFRSHIVRLEKDPGHRVVMHCHATNVVAMTFIHPLDERAFTRTLWQMCTECLVVFPDGVGVLPWMLCGNDEIGVATAEKMREYRLVVWGQHGIFGAGKNIDEAFGLIETVEKAAEIYLKICRSPILQSITDEELQILAKAFQVTPKEGFLTAK